MILRQKLLRIASEKGAKIGHAKGSHADYTPGRWVSSETIVSRGSCSPGADEWHSVLYANDLHMEKEVTDLNLCEIFLRNSWRKSSKNFPLYVSKFVCLLFTKWLWCFILWKLFSAWTKCLLVFNDIGSGFKSSCSQTWAPWALKSILLLFWGSALAAHCQRAVYNNQVCQHGKRELCKFPE